MNRFRAVGLVAGREVREAFRRKSYWAVVGILFVGAIAAMVVPELVGSGGKTRYDVTVAGEAPSLVTNLKGLEDGLDATIRVTTVRTTAIATERVKDGVADLGIVPGDQPRIIVKAGEHDRLVGAARQALASDALATRLQQAGLSDRQVRSAFSVPTPKMAELDKASSDRRAASFAISLVLYILLLTLMMQVANGVAVEKANRISEVLLAIVRPGSLLFGKVLGVGATGLIGLLGGLVPVLVKLGIGGDLPNGLGGALLGSAAWFVLGMALYLSLAGALGALVERQEEAGSVVTPLMAVLIATFIVAQSGPDTPLGTVLAYVPLSSPLMVPTRLAMGIASPVELVASLLLLVATIALAARFGSTIYGRAVVRTGRRLKLTEVLGA